MPQPSLRPHNQDPLGVEPEDRCSFNSLSGFYLQSGPPLVECKHLANKKKTILF